MWGRSERGNQCQCLEYLRNRRIPIYGREWPTLVPAVVDDVVISAGTDIEGIFEKQ